VLACTWDRVSLSLPEFREWSEKQRSFSDVAIHATEWMILGDGEAFLVKKITTGGAFCLHNRLLYLASAMVDQYIGLEETDDGIWAIHFNTVLLATFDERDYIITG
jgi:hypothetical protein